MRLLSKILKQVEINSDKPFKLKSKPEIKRQITEEKLLFNTKSPRSRLYEDEAQKLMDSAVTKASKIIEQAKREADEILINTRKQCESIEKKAFDKGYEDGLSKGIEVSKRENSELWKDKLNQFNKLRQQLYEQNKDYKLYLEEEGLKLALHIAKKILGKEVKEQDGFLQLVKKGLDAFGDEMDILIRVSEDDFYKIDSIDLTSIKSSKSKINIIKDPLLSPGDCIIESNYFQIDAGIRTQIEHIESELKEMDVI